MSKGIGGIGGVISFVAVATCWLVMQANKNSHQNIIRERRLPSISRIEKFFHQNFDGYLFANRGLLTNALYKVACGMDRGVVYEEFVTKSKLAATNEFLATSIRDLFWAMSDVQCAIADFSSVVCRAKRENINCMLNETAGLNLPVEPELIMQRTSAMTAILEQELSNVLKVVSASSNKIVEVSAPARSPKRPSGANVRVSTRSRKSARVRIYRQNPCAILPRFRSREVKTEKPRQTGAAPT